MNPIHKLALLLMLVFTTMAIAGTGEFPHMRAAIDQLEAAKTAKNPLTNLKAARHQLEVSKANKEGQRKQAIACVDEAIAFLTTGDRKTMQEKIVKAIGNAKSGIARAP